ncbi:16S rRNA (guanine(527)-N(7))-methyltransferase RsmG [bacterium]|nr:16S rRNA (guanine(527)-N(7))-methyltransferase RsmG [bacterium]
MKNIFERYNISLDDEILKRFERYRELLQETNRIHNITAIEDDEKIGVWHFLDSVQIGKSIEPLPKNILDMGSGAGFPSLVLSIIYKESHFTLVDSVSKKTAFLELVKKELSLHNVTILHHHLTEKNSLKKRFDLVLSRAFMKPDAFVKFAQRYKESDGKIVLTLTENQNENFIKNNDISKWEIKTYPFEEKTRYVLISKI